MVYRPIIFSGPMVQALLAGRKTMTRRLAWQPYKKLPKVLHPLARLIHGIMHKPSPWQKVKPGDRLWVRETWQAPALCDVQYQATATERIGHWDPAAGPWRPSIHMPRWASRLTLVVTATKIEKLQAIDDDDARAEGIGHLIETYRLYQIAWQNGGPRHAFEVLWVQLHGEDAWAENPEVVALTFTVHKTNIDQMKAST